MISKFKRRLSLTGFSISHGFQLSDLDFKNAHFEHLTNQFESAKTGLLIGNTFTLWDPFIDWLKNKSDWKSLENPLERYAHDKITSAVEDHFDDAAVFWTRETTDYLVPVQKLCHHSGLAYLSRGHFNVHPLYGPWFALRALVLLPGDYEFSKSPVRNPSDALVENKVKNQFDLLCKQASSVLDSEHVRTRWQGWLALRDMYEVGKEYRYSDSQIRYHYTHDKEILEAAVASLGKPS
jgi:hypothetical protein